MDSYSDILTRMKQKYRELSGCDITEGSDADIRMKTLAGEIFAGEVNLDFIKRQMFPSTAVGGYLELHAQDRGLSRKSAVKAQGEVVFSVENAREADITIPSGTVVSVNGENPLGFVTKENAVLEAGELSVIVPCEAERGGADYNVRAGSVCLMTGSVVGIDSVTNSSPFSDGADEESDEALRARVISTMRNISNGTNAAYYKRLAQSVESVASANVVPNNRGAGTLDVFISGFNRELSASKVAEVEAVLRQNRELNVDVKAFAATSMTFDLGLEISVKDGYTFSEVKTAVEQAVTAYIDSLGVGEKVLSPHVSRAALEVEGVYTLEFMSNYPANVNVPNNCYAVLDNIFIEEV